MPKQKSPPKSIKENPGSSSAPKEMALSIANTGGAAKQSIDSRYGLRDLPEPPPFPKPFHLLHEKDRETSRQIQQLKQLKKDKEEFDSAKHVEFMNVIEDLCRKDSAFGEALKDLISSSTISASEAAPKPVFPDPSVETLLIVPDEKKRKHWKVSWRSATDDYLVREMTDAKANYILLPVTTQNPPMIKNVPYKDSLSVFSLFGTFKIGQLAVWLGYVRSHLPSSWLGYGAEPPEYESDAYFVEQRLLGVNPCELTKVSDHILTQFPGLRGSTENLFMCNYSILVPFSRELLGENSLNYIPSPICIFSYDSTNQRIKPVAIMLDQSLDQPRWQVVYNNSNSVQWRYAKLCVRVADWNVHELGSHLTLCHFVSEVTCVTTMANLPQNHPIFQLLLPHFFHTLPLNDNARTSLVPTFIASQLSAFNTEQCFKFCAAVFKEWNFKEHYVPNDLKRRGVQDLPQHVYPFATTATSVWNCIREYVKSVLEVLDAVDQSKIFLKDDYYFQRWCKEMRNNVPGFPVITDSEELCDALTMIIYTATHQHSAVNYFQRKYMAFVPAAPGFLTFRPPSNLEELSEESLKAALPNAALAAMQTALVDMLSDLPTDHQLLSEFEFSKSPHYVRWNAIETLLGNFQRDLDEKLRRFNAKETVAIKNLAQSVLI